ncbi:MAG: endonuclease/exonuclease/phosphatase family protein [Deltaproteobacteria bacterium]|nr:endonuclease/exonuclease/phosphatase family protein [Deltaproteobacteria bacterium]
MSGPFAAARRGTDSALVTGERRFKDFVALRLAALAMLPALVTFASFVETWPINLAQHFSFHVWMCLSVLVALLLLLDSPRWAVALFVPLLIQSFRLAPLYAPGDTSSHLGPKLTVLELNTHRENSRTDQIVAVIERNPADVVLLVELTDWHAEAVERAMASGRLPHRALVLRPRSDGYGIGALTKLPGSGRIVELGRGAPPSVELRLLFQGQPVALLGLHAPPPLSANEAELNRTELLGAAGWARTTTVSAKIVAGDLNATRPSTWFRPLLDVGLTSAELGQGYGATWPTSLGGFGIPIDHVLFGGPLRLVKRELIEGSGSDHFGQIVTFERRLE